MLACALWLQRALFLWSILDNCLGFVVALLGSLLEPTASRSTQFPGLLGAPGDGRELLHILLGDRAHLLGPLGALGVGCVARGFIPTFLLYFCCAINNIILNIMNLLLCPALRLIFCSADLRALNITILHQRCSADLDCLVERDGLVLNEAGLPVVLLALLLLLGLVVGDVCGMAPLVVGVVALHNIIILSLLDHLNLVNASLTISTGTSSCYSTKAHI